VFQLNVPQGTNTVSPLSALYHSLLSMVFPSKLASKNHIDDSALGEINGVSTISHASQVVAILSHVSRELQVHPVFSDHWSSKRESVV
jgi:hypothetical protein